MSAKSLVRKAALKVAGYSEIPIGGRMGMTLGQEAATALQMGMRPAWYPDDPRHPCPFFWSKGETKEATPEEAADALERVKGSLERHGLTFAEPGDPDGFMVKWKSKALDMQDTEGDADGFEDVVCPDGVSEA